jgi:ferritin-like metal-binding protein YciE
VGKLESLHELLIEELEDIYSAERQLLSALPRLAEGATDVDLRRALRRHSWDAEAHVVRLERIFEELQELPRGRKSRGMEVLLDEWNSLVDRDGDEDVIDAAFISAAMRVAHFGIVAYGSASAHAGAIGHELVARLLDQSLADETGMDRRLAHLADGSLTALAGQVDAP